MKITTRTQKGHEAIIEGDMRLVTCERVAIGGYLAEMNKGSYMIEVNKNNAVQLIGMKLPAGYTKGLVSIVNHAEFLSAVEELKNAAKRVEALKIDEARNMKIVGFRYTIGCDAPSYRTFEYENQSLSIHRNDEKLGKQLQAMIEKCGMQMNLESTFSTYGGYELKGVELETMIEKCRIEEIESTKTAEIKKAEKDAVETKRISDLIETAKTTGQKQVVSSSFAIESRKDYEIYHYTTEYIDASGIRTTENKNVEMS